MKAHDKRQRLDNLLTQLGSIEDTLTDAKYERNSVTRDWLLSMHDNDLYRLGEEMLKLAQELRDGT